MPHARENNRPPRRPRLRPSRQNGDFSIESPELTPESQGTTETANNDASEGGPHNIWSTDFLQDAIRDYTARTGRSATESQRVIERIARMARETAGELNERDTAILYRNLLNSTIVGGPPISNALINHNEQFAIQPPRVEEGEAIIDTGANLAADFGFDPEAMTLTASMPEPPPTLDGSDYVNGLPDPFPPPRRYRRPLPPRRYTRQEWDSDDSESDQDDWRRSFAPRRPQRHGTTRFRVRWMNGWGHDLALDFPRTCGGRTIVLPERSPEWREFLAAVNALPRTAPPQPMSAAQRWSTNAHLRG
ncbi:hypothetical protein IWZ01DRAFT_544809 [Phyllosticta capitalensis]